MMFEWLNDVLLNGGDIQNFFLLVTLPTNVLQEEGNFDQINKFKVLKKERNSKFLRKKLIQSSLKYIARVSVYRIVQRRSANTHANLLK